MSQIDQAPLAFYPFEHLIMSIIQLLIKSTYACWPAVLDQWRSVKRKRLTEKRNEKLALKSFQSHWHRQCPPTCGWIWFSTFFFGKHFTFSFHAPNLKLPLFCCFFSTYIPYGKWKILFSCIYVCMQLGLSKANLWTFKLWGLQLLGTAESWQNLRIM